MYRYLYIILISFIFTSLQAFIFGEKEPLLFCIKVCPLYCSPRRRDDDASSLIYIDDPRDYHHDYEIPYHFDPYYYCKPKPKPTPTTTTPAPTTMKTTTEEPTWICMLCMNKCTKYPK